MTKLSPNVSGLPQKSVVEDFEKAFAGWLGIKHAIAVSSGSMADLLALAVLKVIFPTKNEVMVPALTFIAQPNAIIHAGLKPVFVDVNANFQMYLKEPTHKTLCIFPMHILGKPEDMASLSQYCSAYRLPMIEDACEAMGSEYSKDFTGLKKCGTFGDMATFSLFPSHVLTTGEGGFVVTNNDEYAELARKLRNHGRESESLFHFDMIGFNAKMGSLQAEFGLKQIGHLDAIIEKRRNAYFKIGGGEDRRQMKISPHGVPVFYGSKGERDDALIRLGQNGIECRNLFSSIPTQEKAYAFLGHKIGDFQGAEWIGDHGLYVPCHQDVTNEEAHKIKELINQREPAIA